MKINIIASLILLTFFISIVHAEPGYSNSPPDEWWMIGGNNSFARYATANAPANITNATVIIRSFPAITIDAAPIIVGNSLFIIPDNFASSKAYELNATNISQHYQNSTGSYTIQGSPTYYNGSLYLHSSGSIYHLNASNLVN